MFRKCTRGRRTLPVVLVICAAGAVACQSPAEVSPSDVRGPASGLPSGAGAAADAVRVVTVGDIVCESTYETTDDQCQQMATADLASSLHPDAVVALGDLQYQSGELAEFRRSWAPSWGRFDSIIAPVPGNHEYETDAASGYESYFQTGRYYARQIGAWRFYLLDSNCDRVDCTQEAAWLTKDLAAHPTVCSAIAMHHPRWSSSTGHGSQDQVDELWTAAVDGGVDLSLAGHDHDYERFAPIDAAGRVTDDATGATHFVVGTGGRSLYKIGDLQPGSAFATADVFGVLELDLKQRSFNWSFVDVSGDVLDAGDRPCS